MSIVTAQERLLSVVASSLGSSVQGMTGLASQLATVPPTKQQATTETIPWDVDMTPNLAPDTEPTDVACTFTDFTPAVPQDITLEDEPTVDGMIVTQVIRGSYLTAGHSYQLLVTYNAGGSTVLSSILTITCPQ